MYINLLTNVFFLSFQFLSAKCCRSVSIHTLIDVASIMFAEKKSAVMFFVLFYLSLEHIRIVLCLQRFQADHDGAAAADGQSDSLVLIAHLFICDRLFIEWHLFDISHHDQLVFSSVF